MINSDGFIASNISLPIEEHTDGSVTVTAEGLPSFVRASAPSRAGASDAILPMVQRFFELESGYLSQYAREHGGPISPELQREIRSAFERVFAFNDASKAPEWFDTTIRDGRSCDGMPLPS